MSKQKTAKNKTNNRSAYGGELAYGKRKGSRPLSTTNSHHVVLRAEEGTLSFLRKERRDLILSTIKHWAKYFGVKVYAQSINSNHVHLVLYGKSVSALHGFLRVCPGQIAQRLGKEKARFWKHLAFSRIIAWGRAFYWAIRYVEQNTLEAAGLIPYSSRKSRYAVNSLCTSPALKF